MGLAIPDNLTIPLEVYVTLSWTMWRDNERVQRAEQNSPAMKPGDKGQHVHLLQAALILNDIDVPHHGFVHAAGTPANQRVQNNNYQQETQSAVRTAEQRFNLTRDQGVAGREVVQALDNATNTFYLANAGRFGAARAASDAPRARLKVDAAISGLSALRATMGGPPNSGIPLPNIPLPNSGLISLRVVNDALRDQFRLLAPGIPGPGFCRLATTDDIDRIMVTFFAISLLLRQASTAFVDGIPVNGVKTAAEAFEGSLQVTFGPMFRDFDGPFGGKIGRGSRVAVIIHEGMHAVDTSRTSGRGDIHISEFEPAYESQPADLSMFNPSSYATFAAHVFHGRDRQPRFGLGPGARGLED